MPDNKIPDTAYIYLKAINISTKTIDNIPESSILKVRKQRLSTWGYEAYQNRINRGYEAYQNRVNRGYEAYQNRVNKRNRLPACSFLL